MVSPRGWEFQGSKGTVCKVGRMWLRKPSPGKESMATATQRLATRHQAAHYSRAHSWAQARGRWFLLDNGGDNGGVGDP